MLDNNPLLVLAEPKTSYRPSSPQRWIEVLVDYPGEQGLLTYRLPEALTIHPGDILCVPLGAQLVGGIAVRLLASPPLDLAPERIREVEDVITSGFFPPSYWQLIEQVAQYYCTGLITVTRVALPPGLLEAIATTNSPQPSSDSSGR